MELNLFVRVDLIKNETGDFPFRSRDLEFPESRGKEVVLAKRESSAIYPLYQVVETEWFGFFSGTDAILYAHSRGLSEN